MQINNNISIGSRIKLPLLRKGLGGQPSAKAFGVGRGLTLFLTLILMTLTPSFAQNLSVMTYNIRLDIASDGENAWPNRKAFLTNQIKFYSPDIFGVQEARPNQMVDLKAALPEYKSIGHGRDGGNEGEHSAIFYNTNKVKVEKDSTFWLSEIPEKRSKGWDAAYERVCTYGLFTDLKSLEKVWVFNTHLDHIGQQSRMNGMALILKQIEAVNTENYPVILTGDFNVEPDNELIVNLKQQMDDTEDVTALRFGNKGTFNGFKFTEPVTRIIDYIFVSKSPKVIVKKYAVLTDSKDLKYPSDHFPVFVQLELE